MATRWTAVVFDTPDARNLARWWAAALGWEISYENNHESDVMPPGDQRAPGQIELCFGAGGDHKASKNRIHLDLASDSKEHQAAQVERLLSLGARPADIGQDASVPWVVLADPEGNEFCVLDPRSQYRHTGAIAAVVIDTIDPASLASFWASATGWPAVAAAEGLVSLQPPVAGLPFVEFIRSSSPKVVKDRLHLDVAPFADDDRDAEVQRLVAIGARPLDIGQEPGVSWVVLADPEDNEFCVLSPRGVS
jgi:predicted enzyme related to lactoylglutathione lyase